MTPELPKNSLIDLVNVTSKKGGVDSGTHARAMQGRPTKCVRQKPFVAFASDSLHNEEYTCKSCGV